MSDKEDEKDDVYKLVQRNCPNMTCCPACRVDDFTHVEGCGVARYLDKWEESVQVPNPADSDQPIKKKDPGTSKEEKDCQYCYQNQERQCSKLTKHMNTLSDDELEPALVVELMKSWAECCTGFAFKDPGYSGGKECKHKNYEPIYEKVNDDDSGIHWCRDCGAYRLIYRGEYGDWECPKDPGTSKESLKQVNTIEAEEEKECPAGVYPCITCSVPDCPCECHKIESLTKVIFPDPVGEGQKLILDACCGGKMMWVNKNHPCALYIDIREEDKGYNIHRPNTEVKPDYVMDFRDMSFDDKSFKLVFFEPPHMKTLGETSTFRKQFGCLNAQTWQYDIRRGFNECWRVLEDYGVLLFKWSDSEIPFKDVLKLAPSEPLVQNVTNSRGDNSTMWFTFMKIPAQGQLDQKAQPIKKKSLDIQGREYK